ncbi:YvcK family protein [Candidatus Kaiserbacteria bacterium CG10_big_fil_rev_8_21_14_0_10_56_12]|uniref:YvcK family protein n=1 Tax=Candidatus Kaiserbacteria bacterium CG10_big_fil_rev_8_21_14_0_10_56_12 TaxID=1974611 RepID=A0A2H0U9Q5_9BACT|nr:MAG: YvcK family protein [Candidatus Kaiserbacteria bacterium CG10_big_fil_rev_8_21_14_0_10_56_12]
MHTIVTLGGGSGHSQVLKALKRIPDVQITGVCPSTDSGGSTGVLQREYDGTGYTGDLTKCVAALCDDETLANALSYRYESGPLHTHSVKNLLFHALTKVRTPQEALRALWRTCLGPHRVLPVSDEKTELCASLKIGNTVSGEANIDTLAKNPLWNPEVHSITKIYLKPEVSASAAVLDAIRQTEHIIVSPGDLYSSVIPTLLPRGMREAIHTSSAKIIVILNVMTKKGETDHYTALDFVEKIEHYLGRPADVLIANTAEIPAWILLKYSLEEKVGVDQQLLSSDTRIVAAPLAGVSDQGHVLTDPDALREVLTTLL